MFKKMKDNKKKGFTLIELLIVIAVMGIIAAIALPRFMGVTDSVKLKADQEQAKLFIREIETRIALKDIAAPAADTTGTGTELTVAEYAKVTVPNAQSNSAPMKAYLQRTGTTYKVYVTTSTGTALATVTIAGPVQ